MYYRLIIPGQKKSFWQRALLRTILLFLLLTGYLWLAEYLGSFIVNYTQQLWLEGLLALYMYALGYLVLRPSRLRSYLAVVPLLLFYLISDIFYLAFGKVFRLVNLNELPELFDILPLSYSLPLAILLLLPIALLSMHIMWWPHRHALLAAAPLLLVILLILYSTPSGIVQMITGAGSVPVKYSEAKSVENNGRLTTMLYRVALRLKALDDLAPYRNRTKYEQYINTQLQTLLPLPDKRNVHIIVLESFLAPRLFSKLGFSTSPVHPSFETLFGKHLGLSLSPVFGGATAQAEFEVLCGVPALEHLSSVEFNVFSGSAALCLPGQLEKLGYHSSASNTYKPDFFNAKSAYRGAGFSAIYFPKEFSPAVESYLEFGEPGVEEYIFDKELFDQNLGHVEKHLREHPEKTLFNYLLTIYGHLPHILDLHKRPEIINLRTSYPDDHLSRATNQFYYRTEAIADYVNSLTSLDPESLIILISDHVPPLRNGPNTYKALAYLDGIENAYYYNRIAVIDRGQPKIWPLIHHYDIPALVLNSLSEGGYCQVQGCSFTGSGHSSSEEEKLNAYLRLMANASE
ncbi:MAG: sulfatase-like hydrolase/transferase [gamma proteobacterium symbiont of Lucinoma myriamae]|nr:sulfatase-like hydrolase/transferase [gamma proteobacterium symbiont of Lucinoma myriamae]MCU7817789.1 sulfatase-like hydrolase/transferase [gamma proteobacterium symbiont of Lucinoma myriamae]MCU7831672.1 sulfatase-like hydrolase/transferase [gamma proteobacterium symbiont of Lucinoma myriamae]